MAKRVVLILLGATIYGVLREYFRLPWWAAAAVGSIPFFVADGSGLIRPYEKSARDIMHGTDDE
jgi:hypothetical protein